MITKNDMLALRIFKKIIRNRNETMNNGMIARIVCPVGISEHMFLNHNSYKMAYDEYLTKDLTIPNNTICKDGIVLWKINVRREERKRGGCYRMLMPTFTENIPISAIDKQQGI